MSLKINPYKENDITLKFPKIEECMKIITNKNIFSFPW